LHSQPPTMFCTGLLAASARGLLGAGAAALAFGASCQGTVLQ
jgi:hypothetical protein